MKGSSRQFRLGERLRWALIKTITLTAVGGFAAWWHLTHTILHLS